jgi:hypothetical protein
MVFKLIFSQKYFGSQASQSPLCGESRRDIILKLVSFPRLALLGYRPYEPRLLSLSFSLPLPWLSYWTFWKPTRKPMSSVRELGELWLRLAERRYVPTESQEPPRLTRSEPEAGPVGSVTALLPL